jgi:hypothetical protein
MKCYHTGLPIVMCAHCSGVSQDHPEFRYRRHIDNEPHLFKGRDVSEWRGIGRSIPGTVNVLMGVNGQAMHVITQDTLTKGSCVKPVGFSSWAQTQIMRTLSEVK